MNDSNNMVCDLATGICGAADEESIQAVDLNEAEKKVTLYYATDPICSHCWALEPVLNRLIREYGQYFEVKVLMGGLLAGWQGFSDGGNGIQKPADVAGHWREVGEHSRMPIDGSLWHTHPIQSSYPPSRVYKVIQSRHKGREAEFLRRAREAVFAFNQNIAEEEVLVKLVDSIGLYGRQIVEEAGSEAAQELLEQDFAMTARLGVRGFPTIIMVNEENKGVKLTGARSLEEYKQGLQQIVAQELKARKLPVLSNLLNDEPVLFAKELEVMYGIDKDAVQAFIEAELPAGSYRLQSVMGEMYVTAHR
ncbi:DsbA family protein [Paenibacillus sp. MMS20-IR301]|uniref:DsbA family protein n=1 Tax=Paenibacillus sp. MMS20-IR301 TaxID=2895946 RepID=UPI0028E6E83A|nr:DsbA family protein [Paenibacillus sp. MMS20-IR301]WNS40754.1 DsbA family protein [Paenibacillus sp. MMS20-IR301]